MVQQARAMSDSSESDGGFWDVAASEFAGEEMAGEVESVYDPLTDPNLMPAEEEEEEKPVLQTYDDWERDELLPYEMLVEGADPPDCDEYPVIGGDGSQEDPLWEFSVRHLRHRDQEYWSIRVGKLRYRGWGKDWKGPRLVTPQVWEELYLPMCETWEEVAELKPQEFLLQGMTVSTLNFANEKVQWLRRRLQLDFEGTKRQWRVMQYGQEAEEMLQSRKVRAHPQRVASC